MKRSTLAALSLTLSLAMTGMAWAQSRGVTKDRIIIGTVQDLSGPAAALGKQARQGMQLRVDEINEQGGVNGRKIELRVEDHAYDSKKAVLAAQKLVGQDDIFAMVGHLGAAMNMAALPVLLDKNVINFAPLSSLREMYDPPHRLKYSMLATNLDQMRVWLPKLAKEKGARKICVLYQDDDYGLEVLRGAELGLKTVGMELTERTSYKRGATEFSSQVARIKASGCDLVVLGTVIRETVGIVAESRKIGFAPIFLGASATYSDQIPKLGGKTMDGLYAVMTTLHPYLDDASQPVSFWAKKYKTRFGDEPAVFSTYGYAAVDIFIKGVQKAGPQLTTDSFIKAMDSLTIPQDIFGSPEMHFTATQRLGTTATRLSLLQDGRWKVVSDYAKPD